MSRDDAPSPKSELPGYDVGLPRDKPTPAKLP